MEYITFEDQGSKKEKWSALVKLGLMIGLPLLMGGGLLIYSQHQPVIAETEVRDSLGKIEYSTPYTNVLYENFGFVNEPKLTLPLKTLTGYKKTTFLLDSGAVVSALPLKAAKEVGVDLSKAKRIALQGFSGIPTFAYFGSVTVKIGKRDFTFPAVFSESSGTSYILGRKGFFDQFAIYFDNKKKRVTITTRSK